MPHVFISYSHKDRDFARQLGKDLEVFGAQVWIDEGERKIGDSLIASISSAIDRVEFLALVLSSTSVSSPWVQEELSQALTNQIDKRSIKVLPLLLTDCEIPGFLRSRVYADFRDRKMYDATLEKVAEAMGLHFLPEWLRIRLERSASPSKIASVRELIKMDGTPCPECGNSLRRRIARLEDSLLVQVICPNRDFTGNRELVFY